MGKTELVYISHPYTGDETANKEEAKDIAVQLAKKYPSILFINPLAVMEHTAIAELPYDDVITQCFALLDKCDHIIMTGNWKESKGCKLELDFAIEKDKRIWLDIEDFKWYMTMTGVGKDIREKIRKILVDDFDDFSNQELADIGSIILPCNECPEVDSCKIDKSNLNLCMHRLRTGLTKKKERKE